MKFHNFLLVVGVRRFVSCAKWSGFTISCVITLGHFIEHLFSVHPSNMVYYSYFKDQRAEIVEFEAIFDQIMITLCLVANIIEFFLFAIIIYELVKQYRIRVRINARNTQGRKNAITGLGHFISWTVEMVLFGISQYIIVEHKSVLGLSHWVIFMLLPSMNYIFPTVQILTSPDLRHYAFGFLCSRPCKSNGCGHGTADNEDVEKNLDNQRLPWVDCQPATLYSPVTPSVETQC